MHERSQTIEKDGKYINVYGPHATSGEPGTPLPKKYKFEADSYDDLPSAIHAARKRSQAEGRRGIR